MQRKKFKKIIEKKLTLGSSKFVGANFVDCLNFTDPWFHSINIIFLKVFVLCYLFQRAVLLVIWSFPITWIKVPICDVIVNCTLKVAQLKVSGKPKRLRFLFPFWLLFRTYISYQYNYFYYASSWLCLKIKFTEYMSMTLM